MHVLIASDGDLQAVVDSVKAEGSIASWVVPKKAQIGDDCMLSHMAYGLFARAVLLTDPVHDPSNLTRSIYRSDIGAIQFLEQSLPHLVLAETFPTWKWPTYPRTYTTVPEDIEEELWDVATTPGLDIPISIDESLSDEGAARLAIHLTRERDSELVERKKHSVMNATGTLGCEVCGFDFEARYGALGANFCEVHHLKSLAHRTVSEPTMLEELAVVCSNCHRMLHRRGLVSVIELKRQIL